MLPFARQLFDAESEETREGVLAVVSRLIRAAPDRWGLPELHVSARQFLDRPQWVIGQPSRAIRMLD